jgi:hypothetical protein
MLDCCRDNRFSLTQHVPIAGPCFYAISQDIDFDMLANADFQMEFRFSAEYFSLEGVQMASKKASKSLTQHLRSGLHIQGRVKGRRGSSGCGWRFSLV